MRKITLLLALFLAFWVNAQKVDLLGKTWLLDKIIVQNTEHLFPNSGEIPNSQLVFSEGGFSATVCNELEGVASISDAEVVVENLVATLGGCPNDNAELTHFENLYFSFYGINSANGFYEKLEYHLEKNASANYLTLINPNGDKAIFKGEVLSSLDVAMAEIMVFPNPAKDNIMVKGNAISEIKITDAQGKLILDKKIASQNEVVLDVARFSVGLYFIIIKEKGGRTSTHKILKK